MADESRYYGGKDVVLIPQAYADVEDSEKIVQIENIHKTYLLGIEGVPALRGVSLSIAKGEFIVVFGLSGGGKTTLMNIIGTVDTPTKGSITIDGYTINSKTTDQTLSYLRLKKMCEDEKPAHANSGFVFQSFNLLKNLTALENVELPMILAGDLSSSERRQRAVELLTKVGMGDRMDHLPSQLSGGEQQRVTIARSIANKPEMLLLDEPTGDLDSLNTAIVMQLLLSLNEQDGITLVMVTHDVGLKMFANRVIWMRDGKIMTVEEVSDSTRKKRKDKLEEEYKRLKEGQVIDLKAFANTSLRAPTDYETHPKHQPAAEKPYTFSQEYIKASKMTIDEYEKATGLKNYRDDVSSTSSSLSATETQVLIDDDEL